jgi:O-antigen/teichoic acid export membrane protein
MARLHPEPGARRPTDDARTSSPESTPTEVDHATSGGTVVAGGIWQVASHLAPQLQVLLISVVAARALGPADMGRQSFIAFVSVSVVAVATGGLPFALSRYVGRSMGQGLRALVPRLYPWCWRTEIGAAVLAAAVIVGVGQVRDELAWAWAWAAAGAAVAVLHTAPANLLGGLQKWREVSRVSLIVGLATTTSIVVSFALGGGITEMFLLTAVVGSASVVWTKILADREAAAVSPVSAPIPVALRREALGYAGWMTLQVVLTFVVWQRSEFWFLDHYASDQEIAVYSIAFSAVMSLGRVPFALAHVAFPAFATLDGAGEALRLRAAVNRILRVQLLTALPMTALFVAAGPSLLLLVYGPDYEATGGVLQVLMVGFPLLPLGLTGGAVLMGLGRLPSLVAIYAAGAVVNVALDIRLVPDHGAIGAAWANTVAQSVIGLALAAAVHRLVGGLDLRAGHLARGAVVAAAAMALGLSVADRAGSPLAALLAAGTVVALVAWLGGGLVRVWPRADVDWLADTFGGRFGPRSASVVRTALAPFD